MSNSRFRLARPFIVGVAVAGLLIGSVAASPAVAAPESSGYAATPLSPDGGAVDSAKSGSGRLAQSDDELLARTDAAAVPVIVKVDVDPVASYSGGVDGLAATSPEQTGKALADNGAAVDAYTAYVAQRIAAAQAEATALIPSARMLATYTTVFGGYAMVIPANRAKDVAALGSVAAVQTNELRQAAAATAAQNAALAAAAPAPDADATTFIGADKVWPSLGGRDKAGAGVIVGVIDTGIWPEHPMLKDNGIDRPAGGPWACEFGDGSVGAAFACNDKLVGAYAFLDQYAELASFLPGEYCNATVCSARDSDGHGTHTATTAAGSQVASTPIFGVDRGPISGVAPGASVIAYRALAAGGGYTGDLLAAIGQAVNDGVDIINYSVSGSQNPYDSVEVAFLDAVAAGITVNASAGNSGPGASTLDHASPWTQTVAASTSDRAFTSTLVLTSTDGATYTKDGTTITAGVSSAPVTRAQSVPGYTGTEFCDVPFPADSLAGQVVVCMRGGGGGGRVEKGYFAKQAGAVGMILANPTPMDLQTDNHFLPAIQLEGPNTDLLAFLAAHSGVTASWAGGTATVSQGDVMAGFSSRGPVGEFLKPDITAPGVQVIAGTTPTPVEVPSGPPGELYMAIAGTSMSSPHAAGVSALVKAAHPTWTPGQIKSALMTSSLQSVVNVDGSAAGVFDRGAGSIRADRAIAPVLTISETAANFEASATDPLHRIDLNIPSVYIDPLPGAVSTKRTVTNVSGKTQQFSVKATSDAGLRITLVPSSFSLAPGKSREITVILDALKAQPGWHEGQITISPRSGNAAVVPVAANVGEAEVTFSQTCDPTTIKRNATTTCTVTASNYLPVPVDAKIDVAANPLLQVRSVTAPAKKTLIGAKWSGTLSPALPPTVESVAVTPGSSPAGYVSLAEEGVAPIAGVGDETIVNYNVPSFVYGGETYTRIGVDSNGYLVVGGMTAADNSFEPNIPNAAAPNNVLAPFWTDLNPATAPAGAGLRVATFGDGAGTNFLVFDWDRVPLYGTNALNSFQVWIGLNGTEDITYTYGAVNLVPGWDPAWIGVGAENRDGSSGKTLASLPAAGDEVLVTTAPPTAGGSVSFDYTLKGLLRGTWSTLAVLQSDQLRAIPAEQTKIKVQ